jgi:hypothetical protein
MTGSGLEGAGLESQVAGWATSAISDGAAACGDRGLWPPAGHWKITQYMCQLDAGAVEGAAPASSESSTRLRARSGPLAFAEHDAAPATGRLPARTGVVQADVGVAGAVRMPALPGREDRP